jgi:diaminopimelate decarboxylase
MNEILERIHTPFYIYDEDVINKQIHRLIYSKIMPGNVHYSLMANDNLQILKIVKNQGIGAFASSMNELMIALKAGFDKSQIVFCSSNLSDDEIRTISSIGPILITDSFMQLKKYSLMGGIKEIGIRISFESEFYKKHGVLDVHRQGVAEKDLDQVQEFCRNNSIKVIGLHTYIGTNIADIEVFKKGLDRLVNCLTPFDNIKFVDISGGFGLDYGKIEQDFKVSTLINYFDNEISKKYKSDNGIQIKVEPGRFIIGSAGKLFCSVIEVKEKDGQVFIGVDTNLSNFPRPYIYKISHLITVEERKSNTEKFYNNAYICGNSAKSDDFFLSATTFPVVEEGDILCIHHTGAYCYSMSSNFCALLRPAEYLLKKSGEIIKIRNAETLDTLLENQIF